MALDFHNASSKEYLFGIDEFQFKMLESIFLSFEIRVVDSYKNTLFFRFKDYDYCSEGIA